MTLDEAIERAKEMSQKDKCNFWGELRVYPRKDCDEQLAEWLEELKWYKSQFTYTEDVVDGMTQQAFDNGYNKAIDDFVEYANTMPTVESEDGEIRPMWLEEMAEQLKGEKDATN